MFDFSGFWSEEFGSSGFHLHCPCKLPAWRGPIRHSQEAGIPGLRELHCGCFLLLGLVDFYCWGLLGAGIFFTAGGWRFVTAVGWWVFTAGPGGFLLLWAGGFKCWGWWIFTAGGWRGLLLGLVCFFYCCGLVGFNCWGLVGFLMLWAGGFFTAGAGGFLLLGASGFLLLWAGGF